MSDTKNSTENSKSSQKPIKLQVGKVGFYKGQFAEIKTTRCFFFDKPNNRNIRGVELWIDLSVNERKLFLNTYRHYRGETLATAAFVPIDDFRKYFVYKGAAGLLYEPA